MIELKLLGFLLARFYMPRMHLVLADEWGRQTTLCNMVIRNVSFDIDLLDTRFFIEGL